MKTLQDLQPGECARLVHYGRTSTPYRHQLLSLGLTLGTVIQVIQVAPLGCPVHIEVRGVGLALRRDEALSLQWEPVCCE